MSKKTIWLFAGIAVFGIAGLVMLGLNHPSKYGFLPRCPFHVLTGWYCPGCGSTRAVHYLLRGNLSVSFRCNPILIPIILAVSMLFLKRIYELYRKVSINFKYESLLYKLILFLVIAFLIFRNVPLQSLEWLRPPAACCWG
jgi:hypothetical protein